MLKRMAGGLLASVLLVLAVSGCSYRDFEDKVHRAVQHNFQEKIGGVDGYTSEGRAYANVTLPEEDEIEYKQIGDTFAGFVTCTTADGDTIEKGTQGLEYTLNAVKVYDSIFGAQVDLYGCLFADDDPNEDDLLKNNAFLLMDVTASYTAAAGGQEEIKAEMEEFSGAYLLTKGNADFGDRRHDGELEPVFAYFSGRPAKDDPKLDYQNDASSYMIQSGETKTFQIGLLCAPEFIASKNVYLELNGFPANAGVNIPRKLFVLFPESKE